jgi:signal transduction histidine kinase
MAGFDFSLFRFILLSIGATLYLPILFVAVVRREGQWFAAVLVALYALIGMGLEVFEAFWRDGRFPKIDALVYGDVQVYGALALAFLTVLIVNIFMLRSTFGWIGAGLLVGLGLLTILGDANLFPPNVWSNGVWTLTRDRLGAAWALLGWLIFMIGAMIVVLVAYNQTRQPHLRNRLMYWFPAFLLMLVNDGMILAGNEIIGNPFRWGAAVIVAYIALTHYVLDIRQIIRRVLIYVITALLIMVFYLISFNFVQVVFLAEPAYNPLILGAVISLLLALLFTPLLSLVRRMVDTWLRLDQYDPGRTLHEYSESISNILDMERLASVAVGIIMEDMQVQRGFLFLVDQGRDSRGRLRYGLRAVRSEGERQIMTIELAEDGPIASHFVREARPLLQYDLDLLPAFRNASLLEREWFERLECEVYVPIFSKRQWIGMLAFGAKLTGNRYTEDDLVTLSALANQTAVALENARLVDNLMRLNAELRQARRELEKTNRDLQRIDQTKSDFISVASHELRTPLTVIKGYTEMLLEDSHLDPGLRSVIRGIHDGTMRLHEIMNSMFDIAQIDARSLQLNLQSVNLGEMIREVCSSQSKIAQGRDLTITIDLPILPAVKADPASLIKVFQHLVNNAIKFTPNGGKISITGHVVDARSNDLPEGGVEIIVSDTGVGVDPNYRELIFTKFYQPGELTKHSTSRSRFKGGGAGLGLALSKGIIEAHGGRIWVESPGYDEIHFPGSKFHVLIPLAKPGKEDSFKMNVPLKVSF